METSMNNLIENAIKEKGYTLESFALELGISGKELTDTIDRPSYSDLKRIAEELEVDVCELFTPNNSG